MILGDSAYALSNWLMKPYIDRGNLTSDERSFNIKYSMTREVVEIAFGRLKGRFRGIGKRLDLKFIMPAMSLQLPVFYVITVGC